MKYQNYIFDLYGTLIDIRTDEEQLELWGEMAEIYGRYGAKYTALELKAVYRAMVENKEAKLRLETGYGNPEIDLGEVFWELLTWKASEVDASLFGERNEWIAKIAQTFRVTSRKYLKVYPHTVEVLRKIKAEGSNVYLLSNAQSLFTIPEMEEMGILSFFDQIYISSHCGVKKPEPAFMEKLLVEQGLNREESVMIGNEIPADIGIASKCGMNSYFLNTGDLSEKEIEKQLEEVVGVERKNLYPELILSGDILELK